MHDCYLVFVGDPNDPELKTDGGYGGPPLPERYGCIKGCTAPMRVIGSIFEPRDRTMWRHEPYEKIVMDRSQTDEWLRLIEEAGLPISDPPSIPDEKKASRGLGSVFDWPPKRTWSFWMVVVAAVVLNGWFDYYHPRGILFDIIVVIIWAARSDWW